MIFREIRATYRLHTANVQVRPSELGTAPIQVVQYAKELVYRGRQTQAYRTSGSEQVYAVFGRDDNDSYCNALKMAEWLNHKLRNNNRQPVIFKAIASVPSFEVWL
ncbi:MAG: RloB domain-containing protein [Acidiferrobacter sp.]